MAVTNIKGPPGSQVYITTGAPGTGLGVINDIAIDTIAGNLYKKSDVSVWDYFGTIVTTANEAGALKQTKVANVAVLSGDAVRILNHSTVTLADPTANVKNSIVYGIAKNDASAGANVDVITSGPLYNVIFEIFPPNKLLFLDFDGGITDMRPAAGNATVIGKSLGGGYIFVQPQIPYILGV
jgi:hypothetical protein